MLQRDEPELPRSRDEFRDIVLKSGLTGVAASVLVVAMCSPAGFGGMIGTSLASGLGFGAKADPEQNAQHFSKTPAPLTSAELTAIHETLQSSEAQIDNIRAATDSEIQYMHDIAASGHIALSAPVSMAPLHVAQVVHVAHPSSVAMATGSAVDPHLELAALFLPDDQTEPLFQD
jgi:hypothetical protein